MFWKAKHSVCIECGVHFQPVDERSLDGAWGDRCKEHRKPFVEKALRKTAVMDWVEANWEKYEKNVLEDIKERSNVRMRLAFESLAKQQAQARDSLLNRQGI